MCPEVAGFQFIDLFYQGLDTLKYNYVFLVFPTKQANLFPN